MCARAILGYMMAPVSPSNGLTVAQNLAIAKHWLHFLRTITRDLRFGAEELPITIAAPYIAAIEAGADEASEVDREHGLRDDCAIVERFDLVIAAGYSPLAQLTRGMQMEREACPGPVVDLMVVGRRARDRVDLLDDDDRVAIIKHLSDAIGRSPVLERLTASAISR